MITSKLGIIPPEAFENDVTPRNTDSAYGPAYHAWKKQFLDRAKARVTKGYNPDQARDETGKWTDGGAAAITGKQGVTVYHGTSGEAAKEIKANGLRPPGKGEALWSKEQGHQDGAVYVTTDKDQARRYADWAAAKYLAAHPGAPIVTSVVSIRVPKATWDSDFKPDVSGAGGSAKATSYLYHGTIPAGFVTDVRSLTHKADQTIGYAPVLIVGEVGKTYNPDQERDDHGRWTAGGGSMEFASPNTGNLTFDQARDALGSQRHAIVSEAWRDVDKSMNIATETHDALGSWADGAENSVVTSLRTDDWNMLRANAAMKGWLGNQKAVGVFMETPDGSGAVYRFDAKGEVGDIRQRLLDGGIDFHTLVPTAGGAHVLVLDSDGSSAEKVAGVARTYGTEVKASLGRVEFIGTSKSDGTDAEQRTDARSTYEAEIASASAGDQGGGIARAWAGVRDRWSTALKALVALLKGYNPDQSRDEHGRWSEGSDGAQLARDNPNLERNTAVTLPIDEDRFLGASEVVQDQLAGSGKINPDDNDDISQAVLDEIARQPVKDVAIADMIASQGKVAAKDVATYRDAMTGGKKIAPILVLKDGDKYLIADGHTRAEAAKANGLKTLAAHVLVVPDDKIDKTFNPDQERDDHGRWTGGGGDGAAEGVQPISIAPKAVEVKDHGMGKTPTLADQIAFTLTQPDSASREYGTFTDKNGKLVMALQGTGRAIAFDKATVDKISNGGEFVHNHPGEANLSSQDLLMAQKHGVGVTAAALDGGVYSAKGFKQLSDQEGLPVYVGQAIKAGYRQRPGTPDSRGNISDENLGELHAHALFTEAANRGFMTYKATPGSGLRQLQAKYSLLAKHAAIAAQTHLAKYKVDEDE